MSPFAVWSKAVAVVESEDNPNIELGDNGQAAGRWQQHPSFTQEWAGRITWGVSWTWDQVFQAALEAFYQKAVLLGASDETAAVGFHLTGQPNPSEAEINSANGQEYASRFRAALTQVQQNG
jgi:hypothetical protein